MAFRQGISDLTLKIMWLLCSSNSLSIDNIDSTGMKITIE